jgi:hypothetical protein
MKVEHADHPDIYNCIKEAACMLFRSRGFEKTSVTDVVGKLQIKEQTFFYTSSQWISFWRWYGQNCKKTGRKKK